MRRGSNARIGAVASLGLSALALCAAAAVAAGLDPSFGSGGVSTASVGSPLAIDDLAPSGGDGTMTAAVASWDRGGAFFGAARIQPNGSLDPSYGANGIIELFGSRQHAEDLQAQALSVQENGSVLLVGYRARSSGRDLRTAPLMARLLRDGTLDRSFGEAGVVMPAMRLGGDAYRDIAIQGGGRIVAVGVRNESLGGRPAGLVVAHRRDGSIDQSFGERGRVLFPAARDNSYTGLSAIASLPDRKLLVSGYRHGRLLVARLRADGALDPGFGGDGIVSIGIGDTDGCLAECGPRSALALQRGGTLVLANRPSNRTVLTRLRADGRIDLSFGRRGFISAAAGRRLSNAYDLAVQGNGRIVVVGADSRLDADDRIHFIFGAMRFLPGGEVDRSFGNSGLLVPARLSSSSGFAALTQPGGHVVGGGGLTTAMGASSASSLLLMRFVSSSAGAP